MKLLKDFSVTCHEGNQHLAPNFIHMTSTLLRFGCALKECVQFGYFEKTVLQYAVVHTADVKKEVDEVILGFCVCRAETYTMIMTQCHDTVTDSLESCVQFVLFRERCCVIVGSLEDD